MAAILNCTMLDLAHLGFSHLGFSSQTHSHLLRLVLSPFALQNLHSFILTQLDDGSHLEFYHVGLRKLHSFNLINLMMAAFLNSPMLDSDSLFSSLRITQKHSHSTLTLTQTNSIWLKLIHIWLNLMMAAILNSGHPEICHLGFPSSNSLTLAQDWFPPSALKNLHSFILTQLDDGSHLEIYHVGFRHCHVGLRHLVFFSQIHSKTLSLHSESDSNLFNLTQTSSFWLNLMMAAILNSAMLDPDTLFSSLRFTQKQSHSTLTLTQTNLIWLKLIHSHSTWWWQPSWILPSWIWPSWIQPS